MPLCTGHKEAKKAKARTGQFLRRPQFEAFEMYVFLKEYMKLRPVHEMFADWYQKQNGFERRGDVIGLDGRQGLSEEFVFNKAAYEAIFKKMQAAKQVYSNYIFALTMGVGKTLLMATCIFYEFVLARKWENDPLYCHNALIFAADKTVLQSLLSFLVRRCHVQKAALKGFCAPSVHALFAFRGHKTRRGASLPFRR